MIKINLLPVPKAKKAKKAAETQYEFVLSGALIVLVVLTCGYFWYLQDSRIGRLQDQKAKAASELALLKAKVKEVENYENNKKILEEKNRVIEQLKKNQEVPVHLLDEISRNMDPLKIWLVSLSAQGGKTDVKLDIDGKAITNSDIVEFISNLKRSKYFMEIQLIESRQAIELNVPIYNFKLRCTLVV